MKLLHPLCLTAIASANIIFTHVPLHCSPDNPQIYFGCLRGQQCLDNGTCVAASEPLSYRDIHSKLQKRVPPFSTNGTCGAAYGGTVCNPQSSTYTGGCCSQYGWCGDTPDHCGTGCQSGCPGSDTTPRADGQCGAAFGGATCDATGPYGGCCSKYGYCGVTDAHCLTTNGCQSGCATDVSTISTAPTASGTTPRPDGLCGEAYNGATCDPTGAFGGCCSQYGYCGITDMHCLVSSGCQSGCASAVSTRTAVGTSTASGTASRTDGRCGAAFNGASCDPAGAFGGCCSKYGYCGSTSDHCVFANGCQSGCSDSTSGATTTSTAEPKIGPVSTGKGTADGTCGSSNGGTVCGTWSKGNCCSMYGFCGSTIAHCGAGCQSGNCISAPSITPPGASPAPLAGNGGTFKVVGQAGVPAMHAALLPNGRVFFLDKIENYTQLLLPSGQYAYSSEYNPYDNTRVPLAYSSNAFCSGGAFLVDGRVISLGGNAPLTWLDPTVGDGFNAIRYLTRSSTDASLNGQDWSEPGNKLASNRWYATAQTLPDGRIFVASGSLNGLNPTVLSNNNPTYEILSRTGITEGNNILLEILQKNQPYYMYPFIHLIKDGTMVICVAKSCEQFSLANNGPVQTYPDIPGDYRTYPNTGGSVLLPLNSASNWNSDIIICGGGAYQDITSPTDPSCARINPLSEAPNWEMDAMPEGRGMVEGTLLPDGTVLWINGGSKGAQGFGLCTNPALEALLYTPTAPLGQRWTTLASSNIPRLYHSCALLLLDGTLLIAGSNPVQMPVLVADANNPYPTEFRVEIFIPPYLQGDNANRRPTNVVLSTLTITPNSGTFTVSFSAPGGAQVCSVTLYHGGFVTHSLHMGHRMLQLDSTGWRAGSTNPTLTITSPPNHNVCPPGPYVVYVMCDGVPSIGQFISVA